jgi:hypothetical protein
MVANVNWDITNSVFPTQNAGILYQNECIRVALLYQHNGTYDRALTPSNQVLLRITLPMLSGAGLQRAGL